MKVLIIEDSPTCADAMRTIISANRDGLEYDIAGNLADGIKKVIEGEYNLVLLDLRLPDSLDPETTLNAFGDYMRHVPTVIVSGAVDVDTGLQAIELGAKGFVLKSEPCRLVPMIDQAISKGS